MGSKASTGSELSYRPPLVDSNKPKAIESYKDSSSSESSAGLFSEFIEYNNRQIESKSLVSEIIEVVEKVKADVTAGNYPKQSGRWVREIDNLSVYCEVLVLFQEGRSQSLRVFADSPQSNMIALVHNFSKNPPLWGSSDELQSFFAWLEGRISGFTKSACSFPISAKRERGIISYKLFRESTGDALRFILDAVVLCSSSKDPFLPRRVDDLLIKCMRQRSRDIKTKAETVRDWFFASVDLEKDVLGSDIDSSLARFMGGNFIQWDTEDIKFSCDIGLNLSLLIFTKISVKLDEYVRFLPALVALSIPFPDQVSMNWPVLVAYFYSKNSDLVISALDHFKTLELGNFSVINRNFGQLGIGFKNPFEALYEVQISGGVLCPCDEASFVKTMILALLFLYESEGKGLDLLEVYFGKIDHDSDKLILGKMIIDSVFNKCVGCEVWDEAVLSSAVSVIDFCLRNYSEKNGPEIDQMREYWKLFNVMKFSQNNLNLVCFENRINTEKLPEWIAEEMYSMNCDSDSGKELSRKFGIEKQVNAIIVDRLLREGFDKDIDLYLNGLDREEFSIIVTKIVRIRLSVLIRLVAEDSGRLHSVFPTVFSAKNFEHLLQESVNSSRELEDCLISWITQDGAISLLRACKELLFHPYCRSSLSGSLLSTTDALIDIFSNFSENHY